MTTFSVPVVDIGAYTGRADPGRRRDVAQSIDCACATVGFMQIVGHGIADSVMANLAKAIDAFFALPLPEKLAYRSSTANRGYTPPKGEALSLSAGVPSAGRMKDFFEAFNVGVDAGQREVRDDYEEHYAPNTWPTTISAFRPRVEAYFVQAQRVARTLTDAFADALHLPAGYFGCYTDRSIDVLRVNNYALEASGTAVPDNVDLTGMGEHTDFGLVTVLWADRVPGLHVLGLDGRWHDVLPEPGALLVNLGDLMARFTNDHWLSTLHRVKPPIVDGRMLRRRSAAFFHDGNADAVIAPVTSLLGGDREPYPPIRVADHITAKLAGSRRGVLNANATRESDRITSAGGVA